jgi:hypothetical protein
MLASSTLDPTQTVRQQLGSFLPVPSACAVSSAAQRAPAHGSRTGTCGMHTTAMAYRPGRRRPCRPRCLLAPAKVRRFWYLLEAFNVENDGFSEKCLLEASGLVGNANSHAFLGFDV